MGEGRIKRTKVTGGDWTWRGRVSTQWSIQKLYCKVEIYIMLLTNVTPINLIEKVKEIMAKKISSY